LLTVEEGQSVGYGYTWRASKRSILASIPIGYGDGVSRNLSNKMEGLLLGQRIRQVGRISMDQMIFDVSTVDNCQEGDVITLLGHDSYQGKSNSIHISSWAKTLDTISYELCCMLRVRLPKIYTRQFNETTQHQNKSNTNSDMIKRAKK
jgi:alanine racemase